MVSPPITWLGPGSYLMSDDTGRLADLHTAILWDKDSTLANTLHRQHMVAEIKAKRATWDDYSEACSDDEPVEATIRMMRILQPHHLQIIMTGAGETATGVTVGWLRRHEVPADVLQMRPTGDYTENGLLKVRWIRELLRAGIRPVMFVEDWPQTAEVISSLTPVPVLVVNPCYPAELKAAEQFRESGI